MPPLTTRHADASIPKNTAWMIFLAVFAIAVIAVGVCFCAGLKRAKRRRIVLQQANRLKPSSQPYRSSFAINPLSSSTNPRLSAVWGGVLPQMWLAGPYPTTPSINHLSPLLFTPSAPPMSPALGDCSPTLPAVDMSIPFPQPAIVRHRNDERADVPVSPGYSDCSSSLWTPSPSPLKSLFEDSDPIDFSQPSPRLGYADSTVSSVASSLRTPDRHPYSVEGSIHALSTDTVHISAGSEKSCTNKSVNFVRLG